MTNNLKTCVQNYLMAGYLYNATDIPSFLTDPEWDELCKFIDEHWDEIEHYHKHLIQWETLSTATAMYLTEDYLPSIVKHAAMSKANAPVGE